jgi:hypothetical protein
VTLGVSVGPGSGPDGPRSGLDNFFILFSKTHFLCRSVTTDTINRSFFASYKSYRLLKSIRNIGLIPQILFVVQPIRNIGLIPQILFVVVYLASTFHPTNYTFKTNV